MIRLLRLRRLVQVAVLLLLAALPWLNRDGFTGMKGSLFAFDFFGLPFADPLGAVQIGLSGIIPGWRLIAGALVVLAVELVTGERLWCRWVCPQSVLLALMARLPVAPRLRRTLSRCTCKGEPACRRACSLGLDPRNPRSASPLECTNCGACVLACSRVHGGPAALALGKKD